MNEARYAWKVGIFVAIGLALVAVLLLGFSKGLTLFTPTYEVHLKTRSVGGLKKNANVLLAGVPVGRVDGFDVAPDGHGVIIRLKIDDRYRGRIHEDARFAIEQLGLLGDQYVEITPRENKAPPLGSGQTVEAEEPFSLQETARSAKGLIELATNSLKSVNDVMARVDRTVLSERALTNVAVALDKFREISDRTAGMLDHIDRIVSTNSPAIALSVSNLVQFSQDLDKLSDEMKQTVITNRVELTKAVKNLEATSRVMERLVNEVEAGKGFAGMVLKDQEFRSNMSVLASNMQLFSRNLNEHGLLRNLFFKPKPPKETKPTQK